MTFMTKTNEQSIAEVLSTVSGDLLKADVLGRVTLGREQREAMLDAFEASGMSGQAFALQHGIKFQTFASWIQKRRHARSDYQNETECRKLRMRKNTTSTLPQKTTSSRAALNLIEVDLRKEPTALLLIMPRSAITHFC
jgi:hypothetical protein